jgi:hypothetical protein
MRGLKRGLIVGLVLAVIVFLLPDSVLGALTVGTGLAAAVPAAAPPLGMTARALLAVAAFVPGFALTFWLIRRRRNEWDIDEADFGAAPLSAAEQMDSGEPVYVAPSPAVAAAVPVAPVSAAPVPRDLDDRLARIEVALAALPGQIGTTGGNDLLARIEALEGQISERLAAIDGRLAMQAVQGATGGLRKPAQADKTLADIRRTIDGGSA